MEQISWLDPIRQETMTFKLIHRDKLIPSPFQRNISTALVSRLSTSMIAGFVDPLTVVDNEDGTYAYVDGQHRMAAIDKTKEVEDFEIPCIVVPKKFLFLPLIYNIEKSDNIKDICEKVYTFYTSAVDSFLDQGEQDFAQTFNFQTYPIILAFAYKESGLNSPSLVEPPVKKLEGKNWLPGPFSEAIDTRRAQGVIAAELESVVNEIAAQYNVTDFNLKRSIVSTSSQDLWGRKRNVEVAYEDGMRQLMDTIQTKNWSWLYGR